MKDPTFDADGYPTEETLTAIEKWPVVRHQAELIDLMDFVHRAWRYDDAWEEEDIEEYREYTISTYGWSGNESLISALEANMMFSIIAPWSWRRGGHYVYRIPLKKEDNDAVASTT